jgi:hypothetical protein
MRLMGLLKLKDISLRADRHDVVADIEDGWDDCSEWNNPPGPPFSP